MGDPPRLKSDSGSLEALLLRSSRSFEPPPLAQEEVWRRVQLLTAAGAAVGATGLAAQTALVGSAGSRIAGTLWPSVLKWTAVIAVGLPVAGGAATLVKAAAVHHEVRSAAPVARTDIASTPQPAPMSGASLGLGSPAESTPPVAVDPGASRHVALPQRAHSGQDTPSALRKESLSLGEARAKFAAGDARAALDQVGRLSVEFPHGKLAQEREALAMDCLAALGDGEGARARALAFLARFPESPYLARVRQLAER
jgi:hypothetical protein